MSLAHFRSARSAAKMSVRKAQSHFRKGNLNYRETAVTERRTAEVVNNEELERWDKASWPRFSILAKQVSK
jgi:hypothetical protein